MLKKILFAAVGIAFLSAPIVVSAQTVTLPTISSNASIEQLQALITQLTQILQQLLAQRKTPVVPTTSTLSATQTSGVAPFATTFTAKVPSSGTYSVDFGDGTSPLKVYLTEGLCTDGVGFGACGLSLDGVRHVYNSSGTYTARLLRPGTCPAYADCAIPLPTVLATVSITVTGQANPSTFTVSPTSGKAPLSVNFTSNTGGIINFGDGTSGSMNVLSSFCSTPVCDATRGIANHVYSTPGTYTATLTKTGSSHCNELICTTDVVTTVVGTVTITVTGQASPTTFTASPMSGAGPLTVWFKSTARGTVDYGDGTTSASEPTTLISPLCMDANGVISHDCGDGIALRHVYKLPGTYYAQLITGAGCNDTFGLGYSSMCAYPSVTITVTGQAAQPVSTLQSITSTEQFVRHLYTCVLGREGEATGVSGRVNRLMQRSVTVQQMYAEIFLGAEYQNRNRDNTQYVNDLYQCVLFRAGEASGVADRVQRLNSQSRAGMLDEIMTGQEFTQNVLPVLNARISQATPTNSNLASALTALESALKGMLSKLGR